MTNTMTRARFSWWWLIPLLLLTTWLGARSLNADIVWIDEYHSLDDAGVSYFGPRGPVNIWVHLADRNPWHAPGYFMLLNVWSRLTGDEPAILRAMSLLIGLLTVAWTYRLGRDFVGPRVGLYAAVVLGISAFYAHFLHEMRVYTLFTLLSVFTTWAYLKIISRPRAHWVYWLGFGVGAAALPYAHYYATLPLFAIAIYHLLFVKKDRRWWKVVGLMALAAAAFLPWMSVFLSVFRRTQEFERLAPRALTAGDALLALTHYFSNGAYLLFLGLCALGLTVKQRMSRSIVFLAVALLVLLLLTNEILKIMHGGRLRYLIAMWPLLSLVVGLGLARLHQWRAYAGIGVLALWGAFGLWNTVVTDITAGLDGSSYSFPLHIAANVLKVQQAPGDVIVNYLRDDELDALRYERIASFYYAPLNMEYLMVQTPADIETWPEQLTEYATLLAPRERVWVATVAGSHPSTYEAFEAALLATHDRCPQSYGRDDLSLELFVTSLDLCPA